MVHNQRGSSRESTFRPGPMDIANRLGELFIIGIQGSEVFPGSELSKLLQNRLLGGIILFKRSVAFPEIGGNITSPDQLKTLTTTLQRLSCNKLLIGIDQEGGRVQRLDSSNGFFDISSAAEMGSQDTLELVNSEAHKTASALKACGLNVNFAPVVDLNLNKNNPIIGGVKRSFSADPKKVVCCARTWIKHHKTNNLITCLKHFPGHGSSTGDSHLGFVDIISHWQESELIPYYQLMEEKLVDMVMVGHLFHKDFDEKYPATLSHSTVTGLLREQMGYRGVIVSDDLQMKAISDHFEFGEAICKSLSAGVDMIIIGNNLDHRPAVLEEAVQAVQKGLSSGIIKEENIRAALARIEQLKRTLG